jgi:voltage-gated potassium channel
MAMAMIPPSDPNVYITRLDRRTGPCMFWVSFAFLTILAGMLCSFSIEVASLARFVPAVPAISHVTSPPNATSPSGAAVSSAAGPEAEDDREVPVDHAMRPLRRHAVWLGLLYAAILGEGLAHAWTHGYGWRRHLWYCLVPPLRMGGRDHVDGGSMWLPQLGWCRVDRDLQRRLEKAFSGPMILIALAVLPLFALDWHWVNQAVSPNWEMLVFLWVSESLIWLAFAIEFVIMFSVSPKKFRYCRDHWVDLIIILAPLAGFLRLLRVARALRLSTVSRAARAYRLRGLSQKMFRGLLLVSLVRQAIEGDPAKRLIKLREELRDRELDLDQLRAEIATLEMRLTAEQKERQASGDKHTADNTADKHACNSSPNPPT